MNDFTQKVYLADTDAAGRIFFSRLLEMMHAAYEEFLAANNFSLSNALKNENFFLPITHAEADYHAPIVLGAQLKIRANVKEIREHSFSVSYSVSSDAGSLLASGFTVHTAVSKATGKKIPLPENLKNLLANCG